SISRRRTSGISERARRNWSGVGRFLISITPRVQVTSPTSSLNQITDRSRLRATSHPAYKPSPLDSFPLSPCEREARGEGRFTEASEETHDRNSSGGIHCEPLDRNSQQNSCRQVCSSTPARRSSRSILSPCRTAS